MRPQLKRYQRLHRRWAHLCSEPRLDETAIDEVLGQLDEAWAQLTEDEQRFANGEAVRDAEKLKESHGTPADHGHDSG